MAEQKMITIPVKVKLRPKLIRAAYRRVRDLTLELERTEGDLAVAVAEAQRARDAVQRVRVVIADQQAWCGYERVDVPSWCATVAAALDLGAAQPEETQQ